MKTRNLVLHVNREYFDEIESGVKVEEFREINDYWKKRLLHRNYDNVVIWRAYEKGRFITKPWRGYTIRKITHKHFGNAPTMVFVIRLAE